MALIKDGKIAADEWRHLADEETLPAGAQVTVSLARWQIGKNGELAGDFPLGLRLGSEAAPEDIAMDLGRFGVIVLEFPAFRDGRLFSVARLLRERYRYAGELRARGDFLRDQVFFLTRVGVNAFDLAEGVDPATVLPALTEFSVKYQAGADEKLPLYRRR